MLTKVVEVGKSTVQLYLSLVDIIFDEPLTMGTHEMYIMGSRKSWTIEPSVLQKFINILNFDK